MYMLKTSVEQVGVRKLFFSERSYTDLLCCSMDVHKGNSYLWC